MELKIRIISQAALLCFISLGLGFSATVTPSVSQNTPVAPDIAVASGKEKTKKSEAAAKAAGDADKRAEATVKEAALKEEEKKTGDADKVDATDPNLKAALPSGNPTLQVSGFTVINWDVTRQQNTNNGMNSPPSHISIGASNLFFTVKGPGTGDFLKEYKWQLVFETYPGAKLYVSQNYIDFSTKIGTTMVGSTTGVDVRAIFDANSLVQGANGADGLIFSIINFPEGLNKDIVVNLSTGKSNKISYATPRFGNPQYGTVQLSMTYAPSTNSMGRHGGNGLSYEPKYSTGNNAGLYPDKKNRPFGHQSFSFAADYTVNRGDFSLKLTGVYVSESSRFFRNVNLVPTSAALNPGRAYQIGLILGYKAWQLGAGYLNNLKSRLFSTDPGAPNGNANEPAYVEVPGGGAVTNITPTQYLANEEGQNAYQGNSGKLWNVGGNYSKGAYNFSLVYNRMERKTDAINKTTGNLLTGTIDFGAASGLTFFMEGDYFSGNTSDTYTAIRQRYYTYVAKSAQKSVPSNRALALIIGTKVRF